VGTSFLGEGYRVHTIRLGAQRRQGVSRGLSVADVRVEHEVRLMDFTKWLERVGGSPREVSGRQRIRAILGHDGLTVTMQTARKLWNQKAPN
jgi:hypothetical protein